MHFYCFSVCSTKQMHMKELLLEVVSRQLSQGLSNSHSMLQYKCSTTWQHTFTAHNKKLLPILKSKIYVNCKPDQKHRTETNLVFFWEDVPTRTPWSPKQLWRHGHSVQLPAQYSIDDKYPDRQPLCLRWTKTVVTVSQIQHLNLLQSKDHKFQLASLFTGKLQVDQLMQA